MTVTPPVPLTAERIAQIQSRVDAATEGPWEFWHGAHGDPLVAQVGRGPFGAVAMCNTSPADYGQDNARFIAYARFDIPALLAEVERLTGERDRVLALASKWATEDNDFDEDTEARIACGQKILETLLAPAPVVADPDTEVKPDGAALIAAERRRVIDSEGFTPKRDRRYGSGQLLQAARAYLDSNAPQASLPTKLRANQANWPHHWSPEMFKPTPDNRVRELVKAGQFIAAEIDRLLGGGRTKEPPVMDLGEYFYAEEPGVAASPAPVTVRAADLTAEQIRVLAQGEPGKEMDLFAEALHLMVSTQLGSPSLLQRKLHIGYVKALEIMDGLEYCGVVSRHVGGTAARTVLWNADTPVTLPEGGVE